MGPIDVQLAIAEFAGAPSKDLLHELMATLPASTVLHGQLRVPEQAEVSVYVTDDEEVAQLNGSFRGKPVPTNVLSFPTRQIAVGEMPMPLLGDLVFSWPTVVREAAEQDKPLGDHFKHLFIHGLLHLFGYDHISEGDATQMEQLEVTILASMGLENPYQ